MESNAQCNATCRPRRLLRWGLAAAAILLSGGLTGITPVTDSAAQVPGVWGGPGVATPTAPAPPMPPPYPVPYDPRAYYPPLYYPPSYFYPCVRVWVPGYYDAYGNWVFGYYRYQC